jgi:queuine tRNA-ribosyltransferase
MFEIFAKDSYSHARAGRMHTAHGVVDTPGFVAVGTRAAVRTVDVDDLIGIGTQIIIVNTYHMWMELGDVGLAAYPGLHTAMGWDGPLMTDSGGFQVLSLGAAREYGMRKIWLAEQEIQQPVGGTDQNLTRITDEGVYFYENGQEYFLDAKKSITIQEQLGADIIFAFDECTSPRHSDAYVHESLDRTHRWARESLDARTRADQMLFGIVQGSESEESRRASASIIGSMGFDGFGIGGTFGKGDVGKVLPWIVAYLPEERPRHLLGIGSVKDIFDGIAGGMDTFDCVIPTREARHGRIWSAHGRFDVTSAPYTDDERVLAESCRCPTCASGISRAGLRAMFKQKNMQAGRLATMHNLWFFNDLFLKIRASIEDGSFRDFRERHIAMQ